MWYYSDICEVSYAKEFLYFVRHPLAFLLASDLLGDFIEGSADSPLCSAES